MTLATLSNRQKKHKPKSPQAIAAERAAARARDFAVVGLAPESSMLLLNEDVLVERQVRPTPGVRGNADRARRMSGIDWLWTKRRLTAQQLAAALKYGDDHRKANEVSLKSCIADPRGGDGLSGLEGRVEAQKRIGKAHLALGGHAEMVAMCRAVAGEGTKVSQIAKGDDAEVKRLEAVLGVALDLLGAHYGIVCA